MFTLNFKKFVFFFKLLKFLKISKKNLLNLLNFMFQGTDNEDIIFKIMHAYQHSDFFILLKSS